MVVLWMPPPRYNTPPVLQFELAKLSHRYSRNQGNKGLRVRCCWTLNNRNWQGEKERFLFYMVLINRMIWDESYSEVNMSGITPVDSWHTPQVCWGQCCCWRCRGGRGGERTRLEDSNCLQDTNLLSAHPQESAHGYSTYTQREAWMYCSQVISFQVTACDT